MRHLFSKFSLLTIAVLFVLQCTTVIAQDFIPKAKYKDPRGIEEIFYNAFMSHRLDKAIYQRDSLYKLYVKLAADTGILGTQLRELRDSFNALNDQYNQLSTDYKILKDNDLYLQNSYQVLQDKYASLEARYNHLQAEYSALSQKSLSDLDRLNLSLKQKSSELFAREQRIHYLEGALHKQDSMMKALAVSIKNALLNFGNDEISVKFIGGKIYVSLSEKLLFASGQAVISHKGLDAIDKLSEVIKKTNGFNVLIEGFTDNVPISTPLYKDNWDLSAARATNIVRYMVENEHVDPERLTAAGKGEYSPVAGNATATGRAQNRRVEIILEPDLTEILKLVDNVN